MSEVRRLYEPSLGTLAVHFLLIALLTLILAPLIAVRVVLAPLTEAVIRATDNVHDALAERLEL